MQFIAFTKVQDLNYYIIRLSVPCTFVCHNFPARSRLRFLVSKVTPIVWPEINKNVSHSITTSFTGIFAVKLSVT